MSRRGRARGLPVSRMLASAAGLGFVPLASGTVASGLATLAGAGLMRLGPLGLPLGACVASLLGLWAVEAGGEAADDPGWVVIDEVAGQWIALLGLAAPTPLGLLAAFALFRLLDIVKPGPVGWADRQHSAAGVMADDLIAGGLAAGILWAVRARFPHLFG